MDTCSKCGNALRQPNATFCQVCGSAQKPDAPNTAAGKAWQARLRANEHTPAVWRLLWILTGPLSALLFPLHLRAATLRLRRHIRQRVSSPVFATPRFTGAEEGRQIVGRLAAAGRGWAPFWALATFLLALLLAGIIFLSPLSAPPHVGYDNALAGLMGGGFYDRSFIYVGSAQEYEQEWERFRYLSSEEHVDVEVRELSSSDATSSYNVKTASPARWDGPPTDSFKAHRPFEYLRPSRYGASYPDTLYRVQGLNVTTRYDRKAAATVLWIGVAVVYLSYLLLGVMFWRRLARHTTDEAFAAAYARSDTALLDKLLPGVKARNSMMVIFGIAMAVFFPLQLLLFPFFSSIALVRHETWEQKSGVADALGA